MIQRTAYRRTACGLLLLSLAAFSSCAARGQATTVQTLTLTVSEDARGTTVTIVRRRESARSTSAGQELQAQSEFGEEILPTVLIPTGEQRGSVRIAGQCGFQELSVVKTDRGITVSLVEGGAE